APDNGLKLFGAGGHKLTDAQEDEIEAGLAPVAPSPANVHEGQGLLDHYIDHLLSTVGSLSGLHVVVDGAEGAASRVAPEVYRRAGATVTAIHCGADGAHINEGSGATHPG